MKKEKSNNTESTESFLKFELKLVISDKWNFFFSYTTLRTLDAMSESWQMYQISILELISFNWSSELQLKSAYVYERKVIDVRALHPTMAIFQIGKHFQSNTHHTKCGLVLNEWWWWFIVISMSSFAKSVYIQKPSRRLAKDERLTGCDGNLLTWRAVCQMD